MKYRRYRPKKNFKHYKPSRKKSAWYIFFIILIIVLIIVLCIDAKVRPMVRTLATSQASNLATIAINDAIDDVLEEKNITYDNLVTVETADDGSVTSVKSDIININRLKADISKECANEISKIQHRKLEIPIGTLLGNEISSGRGPNIKIYVDLSGDVETHIKNKFESAGINQTIHRIILEIQSNVYVVLPGAKSVTKVKTSVCIAETVIVGKVPETYASLDSLEVTQK